jgi:DNA-binding NtrC family response regulator
MKKVLVATENSSCIEVIKKSLQQEFHIEAVAKGNLEAFHKQKYEFCFIDIGYLEGIGETSIGEFQEILKQYRNGSPSAPCIILAPVEKTRQAVKVVRAGAENYLNYPIAVEEIDYILEDTFESVRRQEELDYLRDEFWSAEDAHLVQTRSPAMARVFEKIKSVAPTKSIVLLTGETGTGKGVLSQLIHKYSNRKNGPYISVHCGAIPENLVESELFGHEKGSFTGAIRQKLGKFELANGGSIFLDEVGTITPSVQIKLLKVLQERLFQRVGGEYDIECDARIITATNIDLKDLSDKGEFRKDLYYRLYVFPIEVTPLRERKEDIPLLAEDILGRLNEAEQKEVNEIHPQVIEAFRQYEWPGNIRELENLIERAYILETSTTLTPESFPIELFETGELSDPKIVVDTSRTLAQARRDGVENIERSYLKSLLEETRGKINLTAEKAGITTRQLHKLLTRYGIRKEEYKK